MTTTSSPWSRDAWDPSSAVTLPPPPAPTARAGLPPPPHPAPTPPPDAIPGPLGFQPPRPRRRLWLPAALALLLVVVVSAGVGSTVTYLAMRGDHAAAPTTQPSGPAPAAAPPSAQVNPADATASKDHVCQVFDVSVRGQQGKGGFRVEGNPNVPLLLRALNSASAVQNALGPAVPPDVAAAARKFISSTLDVTTAAMGNTSTPEVNRLTDVDADAINGLVDACGLPR